MIDVLTQHQGRPPFGRGDVLLQVGAVDRVPERLRLSDRRVVVEARVPREVRRGVAERRLAKPQEAVHIPLTDVAVARVDVDREVEEVADRQAGATVATYARGL